MNIIIPMAGAGKRMRPHTLTTPKPLIPVAGKPIVQRIVEDIITHCEERIKHIGFVIGDFDDEVKTKLINIAESVGAKGLTFYQEEPLGPGHAVHCANELLNGKVIVAFADTLFRANFKLDTSQEGIIWVHKVENPKAFGVVKLNGDGHIVEFVEKPTKFISDLAIIGIYYFQKGEVLKQELDFIINNNIREKGEYQLTTALERLKNNGIKFATGTVDEWLDCGNKNATVITNKRYLELIKSENLIANSVKTTNSVIIPPVFMGENVVIKNSVIGPHVSIGMNTHVKDSVIRNSIIQRDSRVSKANLENSMLGNFVNFEGKSTDVSIGDYNSLEF